MIAIGPAGFMQAPVKRIAWCAKCDGPQECDERGCVQCAVGQEREALWRMTRTALAAGRRRRLKRSKFCINAIAHGPPEQGKTKCTRCLEAHRKSNKRAP